MQNNSAEKFKIPPSAQSSCNAPRKIFYGVVLERMQGDEVANLESDLEMLKIKSAQKMLQFKDAGGEGQKKELKTTNAEAPLDDDLGCTRMEF